MADQLRICLFFKQKRERKEDEEKKEDGSWMGAEVSWDMCTPLELLLVRTSLVQVEATSLRIPTFSAAQTIPGCHLPIPSPPI